MGQVRASLPLSKCVIDIFMYIYITLHQNYNHKYSASFYFSECFWILFFLELFLDRSICVSSLFAEETVFKLIISSIHTQKYHCQDPAGRRREGQRVRNREPEKSDTHL